MKRHNHTVLIVLDGDRVGRDVDVRVDVDAPAVTGRTTDWSVCATRVPFVHKLCATYTPYMYIHTCDALSSRPEAEWPCPSSLGTPICEGVPAGAYLGSSPM